MARLARLDLIEEEVEELTGQLGAILEHAARIQAVDTEGVLVRSHPVAQCNVLREDEPRERAGLDRAEVLAAAPATEAYRFRVPPILEVG